MEANELKQKEKNFKALANRRRLLIVEFLKKEGFANVSEISREINLSFKATSKHLTVLSAVGILDKEQTSLNVNYQLAKDLDDLSQKLVSLV